MTQEEHFSCQRLDEDESKHNEKNGQLNGEISSKNKDPEQEQDVEIQSCQSFFLPSRKTLLVFFLCVFFFAFGVSVTHLTQNLNNVFSSSKNSSSILQNVTTQNDGKIHSDSSLKGKIPVGVDPCDDFYEFVCGSSGSSTNPKTVDEQFFRTQQLILGYGTTENDAEEKAQNFYKSCLKTVANPELMLSNAELTKFISMLEKIPHGNLQEKLQLVQMEFGFPSFFGWSVVLEDTGKGKDWNRIVMKISSGFDELEEVESILKSSVQMKTLMAGILGHRLNFTDKSNAKDSTPVYFNAVLG